MAIVHIKVEDRALADKIIDQDIPNLSWLCTYIDFTVDPPQYRNTQFASNDLEAVYQALNIIQEWKSSTVSQVDKAPIF